MIISTKGMCLAVLAGTALLVPAPAAATWTIVAVDEATGEVGSAGASCTPFVAGVLRLVHGRGAVVAQAKSNSEAKTVAGNLIEGGSTAPAVVGAVTDRAFDPTVQQQQYGVVVLENGRASSAAFTGKETPASRGHHTATDVAVQGNILLNERVLAHTFSAFQKAKRQGLSLTDRLLIALEAGARAGGDARCGSKAAQSAYLAVARQTDPDNHPTTGIIVTTDRDGPANAVAELRKRYDAER